MNAPGQTTFMVYLGARVNDGKGSDRCMATDNSAGTDNGSVTDINLVLQKGRRVNESGHLEAHIFKPACPIATQPVVPDSQCRVTTFAAPFGQILNPPDNLTAPDRFPKDRLLKIQYSNEFILVHSVKDGSYYPCMPARPDNENGNGLILR